MKLEYNLINGKDGLDESQYLFVGPKISELGTTIEGDGVKHISFYGGYGKLNIPNTITSIGDYAFMNCSGFTSVNIPNSVTSIGSYAFDGCRGFNGSLTIPNSVTHIGSDAFSGCIGLTSVTIPDSMTEIGMATFMNCKGLTSITIGNSVKEIGGQAFQGCTGLTGIVIPESVTSIGTSAFQGCSGLTKVQWNAKACSDFTYKPFETNLSTFEFGNEVERIPANLCRSCIALTSITIPASVTKIGSSAFNGCTSLTSIVVSEGNTTYDSRNNCNAIIETESNCLISGCKNTVIPDSVTEIGSSAFSGTGLTSITIPNSVTKIGEYAFYGCTGLTSVNIPDSVTEIGKCAFSGCSGLTSVTCLRTTPPTLGSNAFQNINSNCIIYVPAESVNTYKSTSGWRTYASRIQSITTT